MRVCARVKWRFQRSAVSVSLCDKLKIRDSVVSCSRASVRDAIPSALRLPRPQCGLAMTRKSGRFCLENGRFSFFAVVFCAVSLRIVFQTFIPEIVPFSIVSFRKTFRFPAKPTSLVIARRARAPDAAIFDGTICHPVTNYGCAERNRTIKNKERGSRMKQGIHVFCDGASLLFRVPVLRSGMPYLKL